MNIPDLSERKNYYLNEINRVFRDIENSGGKISYNVYEIRFNGEKKRRNAKRYTDSKKLMDLFDESIRNKECQKLQVEFFRGEPKSGVVHEILEIPIWQIRQNEQQAERLAGMETQANSNANFQTYPQEPQIIYRETNGNEQDVNKLKEDIKKDFLIEKLNDKITELNDDLRDAEQDMVDEKAKFIRLKQAYDNLKSVFDTRGERIELLRDKIYELQSVKPKDNRVIESIGKVTLATTARIAEKRWGLEGLGTAVDNIINVYDAFNGQAEQPINGNPDTEPEPEPKPFEDNVSFKFDDEDLEGVEYVEDLSEDLDFDDDSEEDCDLDLEEDADDDSDDLEDDTE